VKFKLDENIGRQAAGLLRAAGHDVATVRDQGLEGTDDHTLYDACLNEARALITLDRDFGQVLRFPPAMGRGIVVLDLGPHPSLRALLDRLKDLLRALESNDPNGALWIVEPGRIRLHLSASDDRSED
jgi:predicted nuclease of predicted toxin-antitoxin system